MSETTNTPIPTAIIEYKIDDEYKKLFQMFDNALTKERAKNRKPTIAISGEGIDGYFILMKSEDILALVAQTTVTNSGIEITEEKLA
jgi:hypothetical protein